MRFITPDSKPQHIAIIDATDGQDLRDFVPEIRRTIFKDPAFSSVVICRNSGTLGESFAKAAAQMLSNEGRQKQYFYPSKLGRLRSEYIRATKGNMELPIENINSLNDFRNIYGEDLYIFTKLIRAIGKSSRTELRYGNFTLGAHDDYSKSLSLTATMSLSISGAEIYDLSNEFFLSREKKQRWRYPYEDLALQEPWSLQLGDIALMRTNSPVDLVPCIHQAGQHGEDYDQRLIAVAGVGPKFFN